MIKTMTLFDYSTLQPVDKISARAAAERIRVRLRRTAEDIIEIGRDLIAVKAALPHGSFGRWLQAEFGMTDRTAQNFMKVAEAYGGKYETVSHLSPGALYALASAEPDVQAKVEEMLAAGEIVTKADVDEIRRAKERAERNIEAAIEEAESDFTRKLADLRAEADDARAQVAAAQRNAEIAAEEKYRAKAGKMAEAAMTAKQRELGDMTRALEAKQQALANVEARIKEVEGFAQERAAYLNKQVDDQEEERALTEEMDAAKGTLIQLAGAFESRTHDEYSDQFKGRVRSFLSMLDRIRGSVAAAGDRFLQLEAEDVA